MDLNYNLFNTHINEFDVPTYTVHSTVLEHHFLFYELYQKLIHDEIEKTKQLNAKFTKNMYEKNNKYLKLQRNNSHGSEFKKVCSFESIDDENEKLNIIIRTYLNKISNDTYDKVSEQLMEKLLEIKNMNIFKILSEEIVNKCIYDNKYRNIYINLCSKIWNNKKIHYNLITIEKKNDSYYAVYNIDEDEINTLGPFSNVDILKETVFKKLNFKNFFIDFIQELYHKKELNLEGLDDNNFFSLKKKTLLLVELLAILFINKHIQFDIISIIIIDLLHQDDNFEIIKEIEFELLHVMMNFIFKYNKTFKFYEQKKIFEQFKGILEDIIKNNKTSISKRSMFFIESILTIFNKILNDEKYDLSKNSISTDHKDNIILKDQLLEDAKKGKYYYFKCNLEKLHIDIRKDIINTLMNNVLDNQKLNNELNCLKEISSSYMLLFEKNIYKIIENLDDIILDIPNIKNHIEQFVSEMKLNNTIITKLNEKIESMDMIDDEDDDDEDSFSFR